jgi:hypothetical protein
MRQMADRSAQCWWQPGHPGFAIAPLDSDRFLASLQGTPGPFAVPLGSPLLATGATGDWLVPTRRSTVPTITSRMCDAGGAVQQIGNLIILTRSASEASS